MANVGCHGIAHIGVGRRGRVNNLRRGGGGGGGHTLCLPNNPPTLSFNFYEKQEKIINVPLKGKIIINIT